MGEIRLPYKYPISRRDFLKIMTTAASAVTLEACSSLIPTQVAPIDSVEPILNETKAVDPTKIPPTSTEVSPTQTEAPPTFTEEPVVEPIIPQMVLVESGTFQMGTMEGHYIEQPIHQVTLTKTFYIGINAVTYEEYGRYLDDLGVYYPDDDDPEKLTLPVSGVNWIDAVAYCNWLSEKTRLSPCYTGKGIVTKCDFSANGYRLPTEAEWEYAARGGQKSKGYLYAGSNDPDEVGWHAGNSGGEAHPGGGKAPNELGIFDMSGNRWEWCWDWFDPEYYTSSPDVDPTGPLKIPNPDFVERSRRSSSAVEDAATLRTSYRSADFINYPGDNGLRLVKTA